MQYKLQNQQINFFFNVYIIKVANTVRYKSPHHFKASPENMRNQGPVIRYWQLLPCVRYTA